MIVQKKASSLRTKILISVFMLILVGGGYYAYTIFYGPSEEGGEISTKPIITAEGRAYVFDFNKDIFNDPQFLGLKKSKVMEYTEQYEGMVLDPAIPLSPTNISVTDPQTGRTLVVHWTLPKEVNFDSIVVYRSEALGYSGLEIARLDSRQTSHRDSGLKNDESYYYLVRTEKTVDDDTYESVNKDQIAGVPTDIFPPQLPREVRISETEEAEGLEISWINPDDEDFDHIRIYRSTRKGIVGDRPWYSNVVGTEKKGEAGPARRYFIDNQEIESNTSYYYTLTSVDASGNESEKNVLTIPFRLNPFEPYL